MPDKTKDKQVTVQRSGLHVTLERDGMVLYELYASDYQHEIVIGRSRECDWSLADVRDDSISHKHAMISKRRNKLYLSDMQSTNGIYSGEKRISEQKLEVGDLYSLGSCIIKVEEGRKKTKRWRFNQLQWVDDKGEKRRLEISKPKIIIGSADDCDIVLKSRMISSHHVEVALKDDGSCWVRDLNSRNGTKVNNEDLELGGEHILHEGNVITVAYMDITFLDGTVEHDKLTFWHVLYAVVGTALVCFTLYMMYLWATPDAAKYLEHAQLAMNHNQFGIARDSLAKAKSARGHKDCVERHEQLTRRLEVWNKMKGNWKEVQDQMSLGNYTVAREKLGSLEGMELDAWTWPGAGIARKKADLLESVLGAIGAAESVRKDGSAKQEQIVSAQEQLAAALAALGVQTERPDTKADKVRKDGALWSLTAGQCVLSEEEYYKGLVQTAVELFTKLTEVLEAEAKFEQCIARLEPGKLQEGAVYPDFGMILEELRQLSETENSERVKHQVGKVVFAIETLKVQTERAREMRNDIAKMEFERVKEFRLEFGDADFTVNVNLGTWKRQLEDEVKKNRQGVDLLANACGNLMKQGIVTGSKLKELEALTKVEDLALVFSFDILQYPWPRSFREEPSGKYDEILGMEYFYDYLDTVEDGASTLTMEDVPFVPLIYKAREVLRDVRRLVLFIDAQQMEIANEGALKVYLDFCRGLLKLRDVFCAQLASRECSGREKLVTLGLAYYLYDGDKDSADFQAVACREQLLAAWKEYRDRMRKYGKEYALALPEQQITMRDEILAIGLPGESLVKKMWNYRDKAKENKDVVEF